MEQYNRIVNGTAYHEGTPQVVVDLIEAARQSDRQVRLRFEYGDHKTGEPWGDIESGFIGRSTGRVKIPLVIKTTRSTGGGGLLDHCLVRIEQKDEGSRTYREVFRHARYSRKTVA